MASLNKVLLAGNLTREPELRYTSNGAAVADLDLAINRMYMTKTGESRQETCYVRVVIWGKQAEVCNQYLGKGSSVLVEGRLQLDTWETKEGDKRKQLKVRAERVQFLNTRGGESKSGQSGPEMDEYHARDEKDDSLAGGAEIISDIEKEDDDIPF